MRFLFALLFILTGMLSSAQDMRVRDSLSALTTDMVAHDTSRASAFIALSEQLYLENPDTVFPLCEKAIRIVDISLTEKPSPGVERRLLQLKLYALSNMGAIHTMLGNLDDAVGLLEESIVIAKELKDEKQEAYSLNTMANIFSARGDVRKAIGCFERTLELFEGSKDSSAISGTMNNLGVQYTRLGDYRMALDYHNRALAVAKTHKDTPYILDAYTYTADVYLQIGDYDKSMAYYQRDYDISVRQKDKFGIAEALQKIGSIHLQKGDVETAKKKLEESLEVNREMNHRPGIQGNLSSLGDVHLSIGEDDKALEYYEEALTLAEELQEKTGIAQSLNKVANILYRRKQYGRARTMLERSLQLAKEVGYPEYIKDAARTLSNVQFQLGDHKSALENYRLFVLMKDSLTNEANQKEVLRQQIQHEFDKKEAVSEKAHEMELRAQEDAADAQKEKQTTIIFATGAGLALVLLFSIFLFNRFRVTKRQKGVIENQKAQVDLAYAQLEEKNKEVMDSITYAKRIQSAILPPSRVVKEFLTDSFVFYKPKDIVAGDFYWMERTGETILFAACDCTGHGVPGAMVSVVCNNGLNRAVREYGLKEPGKILDKTREIVAQEFDQSEEDVNDGMDIALCALEGNVLKYAGANNPLWVIRHGSQEITEFKATKQPIGKLDNPVDYDTHAVLLNPGDTIYIFSDGLADQFGGDKGKKFKSSNFKRLLLSIQKEDLGKQQSLIHEAFENWKGDLEQIDDVCIIGVRYS